LGKKISAQRNNTGQAERVPHQPGRKLRAGAEVQHRVMDWVASKPDLTLAQLQAKLYSDAGISLSLGRIWHLLKKLGLRLKKVTPRGRAVSVVFWPPCLRRSEVSSSIGGCHVAIGELGWRPGLRLQKALPELVDAGL
jgi:hypothetical protein